MKGCFLAGGGGGTGCGVGVQAGQRPLEGGNLTLDIRRTPQSRSRAGSFPVFPVLRVSRGTEEELPEGGSSRGTVSTAGWLLRPALRAAGPPGRRGRGVTTCPDGPWGGVLGKGEQRPGREKGGRVSQTGCPGIVTRGKGGFNTSPLTLAAGALGVSRQRGSSLGWWLSRGWLPAGKSGELRVVPWALDIFHHPPSPAM